MKSGTLCILRLDRATDTVWPYKVDYVRRKIFGDNEIGILSHQLLLNDFIRNHPNISLFGLVNGTGEGPLPCTVYVLPKTKPRPENFPVSKDEFVEYLFDDIYEFPLSVTRRTT